MPSFTQCFRESYRIHLKSENLEIWLPEVADRVREQIEVDWCNCQFNSVSRLVSASRPSWMFVLLESRHRRPPSTRLTRFLLASSYPINRLGGSSRRSSSGRGCDGGWKDAAVMSCRVEWLCRWTGVLPINSTDILNGRPHGVHTRRGNGS